MRVEPGFEGTKFLLQFDDFSRVDDGRVDLEPVANDTRVGEQADAIPVSKTCYPREVKAAIRFAEVVCFFEDGDPRESRLVDFKHESLEEQVIVHQREAILEVMIEAIEFVFGMGAYVFAVGCHVGN